jgi:hypothetical protein
MPDRRNISVDDPYKALPNLSNLYRMRREPVLKSKYGTDIEDVRRIYRCSTSLCKEEFYETLSLDHR